VTRTVEFAILSQEKAVRMYRAGLRHRILTLPVEPDAAVGDEVAVLLTLPFADEQFEIPAVVKHCSAASTIVQLESLPARLVEIAGGAAAGEAEPVPPVATPQASEPTPSPPGTTSAPAAPPADETAAPPADETAAPSAALKPKPKPAPKPGTSSRRFRLAGPNRGKAGSAPQVPGARTQKVEIGGAGDRAKGGIPVPGSGNRTVGGEPAEEGELEEKGMRAVFLDHLRRGSTGVLVVEGYRERYWVFLVDGRPVRFSREPPSRSDTLDYQASRTRKVEPDALNEARQVAELTGIDIRAVLLDLELLTEEQIVALEARTARQVTERLLGVNYGTHRFFDLPILSRISAGQPADVMRVLWDQMRRKYADLSDKQIAQRIDQYHKHHVVLTDEGGDLVGELTLGKREQGFVNRYLRGGWQLAELLGRLDLTNRSVMEILLTLQDLDVIVLSEREGPNWKLARAERFLIDRMDYLGKDHFAFVDAHWSSLGHELSKACDRVARTLEDPLLDQLELGRIGEMRREISDKLGEVRGIFADRDTRKEYRGTLIEKGKLSMAASLFAKKGEMALFKREATLARDCFLRVLEVDPVGPGAEHVGRARRVLDDISRGVLTEATVTSDDEKELLSLEDLDRT